MRHCCPVTKMVQDPRSDIGIPIIASWRDFTEIKSDDHSSRHYNFPQEINKLFELQASGDGSSCIWTKFRIKSINIYTHINIGWKVFDNVGTNVIPILSV